LRNSGRKTFFSSPMIRFFMSSYVIPVSSSETAKPSGVLRAISEALLEGRFGPGDTVVIDVTEGGELVLTKQEAPEPVGSP
ncbi:MAG TPA: hypothetical protein VNN21_08405, partial [Dehalococcoidia bacterium]|nr:hypothetical protein [Dehalococcoidia bacterium]